MEDFFLKNRGWGVGARWLLKWKGGKGMVLGVSGLEGRFSDCAGNKGTRVAYSENKSKVK